MTVTPIIKPRDLYELLAKEVPALIIDVRTPDEYKNGHIPNAKLLPLVEFNSPEIAERLSALRQAPNQTIYVTCGVGRRAAKACDYLAQFNVEGLVLIEGGTQAWIDENLPITK